MGRGKVSIDRDFSGVPGPLPRNIEPSHGREGSSPRTKPFGVRAPSAAQGRDDADAGHDDALRFVCTFTRWKQHVEKKPVNQVNVNCGETLWTGLTEFTELWRERENSALAASNPLHIFLECGLEGPPCNSVDPLILSKKLALHARPPT
jgi:hypothetical protein